jgi:SAM-dependent methyltransferase
MPGAPQTSWPLSWISRWHQAFVFKRRTRVLAEMLAAQIPERSSVLDIGCGDGTIANLIARLRPDVRIQGVEVLVRGKTRIPVLPFDGEKLPFPEDLFDVCLLVDVLHHTSDVSALLREASRVSRSWVLIKDHLDENALDDATLRFMDWVGNRPYGVRLTFNYQSRKQWADHFVACGLHESTWTTDVPLYPPPFRFLLGRRLHFVSLLRK